MLQIKTVRVFFFVLLISLLVILITSQSNLFAEKGGIGEWGSIIFHLSFFSLSPKLPDNSSNL